MASRRKTKRTDGSENWSRFVRLFLSIFGGGAALVYLFVLLIDPYGDVPFSLPLDRRIVSVNQRYVYPQIVRSKRFDSLIIGTSTARLLDPQLLGAEFNGRFANLAMDSATAWEQKSILELFVREVGPPKAVIVALDAVWCAENADRERVTPRGFPDWLYDANPWNDLLYLLNYGTLEIALRQAGFQLGLRSERVRSDGYAVFVPPEAEYDLVRARHNIWHDRADRTLPDLPPPPLSREEREARRFPALAWIDAALAAMPPSSTKILAFMPVHVASQPFPGTHDAAVEAECKARITAIAQARGAKLIDWRISSVLTRDDANYWDPLHYRVPIANRLVQQLGAAAAGRESHDGSYRILVR